MARLEIDFAGSVGVVQDVLPSKLDKNTWTTLKNGVARDTSIGVQEFFSYKEFYSSVPEAEIFIALFSFLFQEQELYVVCTQAKVYVIDPADQVVDITPTGFSFQTNFFEGWQGILFGGILLLNNGVDEPVYWAPNAVDGLATKLEFLSNAPGSDPWPAGQTAKVLRGYKNALFAMNISDGNIRWPYLVRFSDFAEPGTLPAEWTAATDNSAGDLDLAEGFDEIVDALPFKDVLLIWKERSLYGMRYIGGNDVYKRYLISTETGVLTRGALVNTDDFQAAITKDDIVICDGTRIKSVVQGRNRKAFFSDMDPLNFPKCFAFHNSANKELWFFKPTLGQSYCNAVLIYDYANNTQVTKNFTGVTGAVIGFTAAQEGITWDAISGTWEDQGDDVWSPPFLGQTAEQTVLARALPVADVSGDSRFSVGLLYRGKDLFDGSADLFDFVAERISVPIPRGDKVDWASIKQVTWIVPKLEEFQGGDEFILEVQVGFQWEQNEPIRWAPAKAWTPGTPRLFFHGAGRFISVRFQTPHNTKFLMSGYDLVYELVSRFS